MKNRKFIICFLFILSAFAFVQTGKAASGAGVFVFDNSKAEFFEISFVEKNGVIMVPFRKIFENFGADVTWNEKTKTSRASKKILNATVKTGEKKAVVNGSEIIFSVPAEILKNTMYVPLDLIKKVPGLVVSKDDKNRIKIWEAETFIKRHGWTKLSGGLIAHAGGGLYKYENGDKIPQIYTNSREALVSAYNNGHRVFEIDFLLTEDEKLAAIHDWSQVNGKKSSDELKKIKMYDMYKILFLEDIYKFMLEYPDTFLVTDTKSFYYSDKRKTLQFELLVNTARNMDESLLLRIVPQIYDQNCYRLLMKTYPFESVVYTLYESPDSDDEVVNFVAGYSNIKVVTMMWQQYSDKFYNDLTRLSKYIYFFTINVSKETEKFRSWGVKGFYTDYINPK